MIEPMPTSNRASGVETSRLHDGDLWGVDDLAAFLGVPRQTIYSWRCSGYGPQGFRVGRHLRWRPSTVAAWAEQREASES